MRPIIAFIACLMAVSAIAQNHQHVMDSLRLRLMATTNDVERVTTLNEIAAKYLRISGDSTRKYGQQAAQIAAATNSLQAHGEALKTLGTLAMNEGKFAQANDLYQDALALFIGSNYLVGQGQCYNNLGMLANRQEDFENALQYVNKSLEVKAQSKDSAGIANCYNTLATIYEGQKNTALALEYYRKALAMQEKVGADSRIADAYNNLGRILLTSNDSEALGCLLKAIQIRRKIQDKKGLASSYRNVAEVYRERLHNLPKAIEFATQAIESYKELHETIQQAECMSFLGDIYAHETQYTTAIQWYEDAISLAEPVKSFRVLISAHHSLGEAQLQTKQYGEATASLEKALMYISEQHAPDSVEQTSGIAELLVRVGKESHDKNLIHRYEPMISRK